jgi:Ca2+-binding RTX toxin-like protein
MSFTDQINETSRTVINESAQSGLPGRENGPADAYRHILISAELTRRFGENIARTILESHEWEGRTNGQSKEAEAMDRHNNELGIKIGKTAGSWKDVVHSAREKMNESIGPNDDPSNLFDDAPDWLAREQWEKHPKDEMGNELDPSEWNWNTNPNNSSVNWPNDPYNIPAGINSPEDGNYGDWLGDKLGDLFKTINRDNTYRIQRYDPLALDLDGDGLETVASNKLAGALFDGDADGIRTASGWIKADDGLLVLDRNDNGIIDDGAELFGDSTVLANGQKAAHGFAALADLDSNGDGKVDASDARFAELKVWRDLNQDGASSADELFTLDQVGVAALNNDFANTRQTLEGNNLLAQNGSYVKIDGSTAQMGDVNFANDNLYSRYTTSVEIPEELRTLPNLKGYGRLRDLREAAAFSPALAEVLQRYAVATSKSEQMELLGQVISEWAKTDPNYSEENIAFSTANGIEDANSTNVIWLRPGEGLPVGMLTEAEWARLDKAKSLLPILNAFTGEKITTIFQVSNQTADSLQQAYDRLTTSVYDGLLLQTRLKGYLDRIELQIADGTFSFDFAKVESHLDELYTSNPQKAFVDLAELMRIDGARLKALGWSTMKERLTSWAISADRQGVSDSYIKELGSNTVGDVTFGTQEADILNGSNGDDTLLGGADNDTLNGDAGNDILYGDDGNDTLTGGGDVDQLYGGAGNDKLTANGNSSAGSLLDGGDGDDELNASQERKATLRGGAGNDKLSVQYWNDGIDFEGGTGNDIFTGGHAGDTYRFNLGDGQDTITDYQWSHSGSPTDLLIFGAAVNTDQLWFIRNCDNLDISVIGTEDKVTISKWFSSADYQIETIKAGDGKALLSSQVQNLVDAMASFAPPTAGQLTLPDNYRESLQPTLTANWK